MLEISREQARRFLLGRQLLLPAQSLVGEQAVGAVFGRLRLVQYDPLNPCGRNQDLVLQSRIADYHPDDYVDWVYGQRFGVEGFDKVLCMMPVEDWQFLRFGREAMSAQRRGFMKEHRADLDAVLAKIRDDGPVLTGGIADERRVDIGWYGESAWGKVALESLWRNGELVITRLAGGRKLYDLPERVYGARLPSEAPSERDHVRRRIGSVGMLPSSGAGTGWTGIGLGRRLRPLLAQMIEDGELVEVAVEGVKPTFVMRLEDAEAELAPEVERRMVFLAPLDNLLWDRDLIEALFGFYYRWEVYVPANKRQFGYYVLPILYGDRLVGRIEPVVRDGVLMIKGLWWEPEIEVSDELKRALDDALARFASYARARNIDWVK